jgi:hypothetical protein
MIAHVTEPRRVSACLQWYYTLHNSSQLTTIWWGGPPGPRPTPWSALSGASTPAFGCGYAAWWGRRFRLPRPLAGVFLQLLRAGAFTGGIS